MLLHISQNVLSNDAAFKSQIKKFYERPEKFSVNKISFEKLTFPHLLWPQSDIFPTVQGRNAAMERVLARPETQLKNRLVLNIGPENLLNSNNQCLFSNLNSKKIHSFHHYRGRAGDQLQSWKDLLLSDVRLTPATKSWLPKLTARSLVRLRNELWEEKPSTFTTRE